MGFRFGWNWLLLKAKVLHPNAVHHLRLTSKGLKNPRGGPQKRWNFRTCQGPGHQPIPIPQTPTWEALWSPQPFYAHLPSGQPNNIPWLYKTSDFIPHGNSDAASFICYFAWSIKSLCLANDFLYEIGGRNSNSLNELVFSSKANKKIIYTG